MSDDVKSAIADILPEWSNRENVTLSLQEKVAESHVKMKASFVDVMSLVVGAEKIQMHNVSDLLQKVDVFKDSIHDYVAAERAYMMRFSDAQDDSLAGPAPHEMEEWKDAVKDDPFSRP